MTDQETVQLLREIRDTVAAMRITQGEHGEMLASHGQMLASHSATLAWHSAMHASHREMLADMRHVQSEQTDQLRDLAVSAELTNGVLAQHGQTLTAHGRMLDILTQEVGALRRAGESHDRLLDRISSECVTHEEDEVFRRFVRKEVSRLQHGQDLIVVRIEALERKQSPD